MSRVIFWVSVLAGLAAAVIAWFVLPDRVPLHFGGSGEVDRWGSRTEAVVTFAVMIGGLALLFWVLTIMVPRMPEELLNIRARDKQWWLATPERRQELNRRVVRDLHVMGAATILLLVGIEVLTMQQARQAHPALGPWFWVMVSVYVVGVLGHVGYLLAVQYRAPRDN